MIVVLEAVRDDGDRLTGIGYRRNLCRIQVEPARFGEPFRF